MVRGGTGSYTKLDRLGAPSATILGADGARGQQGVDDGDPLSGPQLNMMQRHRPWHIARVHPLGGNSYNVLFGDQHVSLTWDPVTSMEWNP
jgi:hypothetical protein